MMEFIDLRYWYEAWAYGLLRVSVWIILIPAAMMGIGLAMAALTNQGPRRKRLTGGALLMLLVVLVSPFTFGFKEEVAFRRACYEEAGLHVYQQIELGPEYWLEIDPEDGVVDSFKNFVLRDIEIEVLKEVLEENGYQLSRDQINRDLVTGFAYRLVDTQNQAVISEAKNFWGGPTGFLSQRSRICSDLPSLENMEFPSFSGDLLRPFLTLGKGEN